MFIPILIFNIILFQKLPLHYLKNIAHPIIFMETIARILTIAFSFIMVINIQSKIGKIDLIIYIIGVVIYLASYFIVIYFNNAIIEKNIFVILSPYWTSIIWLIGIGLIGNISFLKIPYHFTNYIILSIIFTTIHTIHGYLCYKM